MRWRAVAQFPARSISRVERGDVEREREDAMGQRMRRTAVSAWSSLRGTRSTTRATLGHLYPKTTFRSFAQDPGIFRQGRLIDTPIAPPTGLLE
jgi:hypothetical protein